MADVQESSIKIPRLVFSLDDVPGDVGDRVLATRKGRRWSQARLAERAGLSRAAVYRLENRTGGTRADTLFRVADALDVPIGELVPAWPEWEPVKGHGDGAASRERRRSLGLTMAQVALLAGVSEATLSRHERGLAKDGRLSGFDGDAVAACAASASIVGDREVPV